MSPLSDVQEIPSTDEFHFVGPPSPLVNSVWFTLYLYSVIGYGPPTLFLSRGTRLSRLPSIFQVKFSPNKNTYRERYRILTVDIKPPYNPADHDITLPYIFATWRVATNLLTC